jgi:hypothetical protein
MAAGREWRVEGNSKGHSAAQRAEGGQQKLQKVGGISTGILGRGQRASQKQRAGPEGRAVERRMKNCRI